MTTPVTTNTPSDFGSNVQLAPWANNYVTSMLGQSSALGQQPYQWYQGAMTAGSSPLQQQAFQGLSSLQTPTAFGQSQQGMSAAMQGLGGLSFQGGAFGNQYTAPGAFQNSNMTTGQWNQQAAQQYMNPYLQESLNPQLDQARRQAEQTRMGDAARLTQAGAFGGSRQAIMESELNRNLMRNQADITGKGYFDAYNTGMTGFMQDQGRALDTQKANEQSRQFGYGQQMTAAEQRARYGAEAQRMGEESRQFGAQYGLDALKSQADVAGNLGNLGAAQQAADIQRLGAIGSAGATQRDIEQQGLDAEYALWAQAQQHPYTSLEFQKNMLAGIPTTISQGNKLNDIERITQLLAGADQINDSGLVNWLQSQLGVGNVLTGGTT
jgi:hypothetical protein